MALKSDRRNVIAEELQRAGFSLDDTGKALQFLDGLHGDKKGRSNTLDEVNQCYYPPPPPEPKKEEPVEAEPMEA